MSAITHPEFAVHMLNEEGIEKAKIIAYLFDCLLTELCEKGFCYPARELAIVKTKLEEACFFAKKAMAINKCNQKLD